jgi:predicted nucleotidyltransferase
VRVKSLNSSVLVWPTRAEVDAALRAWTSRATQAHPELIRVGYFGSYARGNWGVGSDLDIVAIVSASDKAWDRRARSWDLSGLPVAADLLIYTHAEWDRFSHSEVVLRGVLTHEVVWVLEP